MSLLFNKGPNTRIQKIIKILSMIFFFVYAFSISAFGEQKFKKIPIFNYGIYLTYASMICLLVVVILGFIILKVRIKIHPVSLIIPLFVIYAFFGTVFYSKDFRGWFTLLLLCFSFFIFVYLYRILKNKFTIISLLTIALFCFTFLYLAYYGKEIFDFANFFSGQNRLGSDFDNQNGVAAFAVMAFGLSLYLILFYNKKIRFLFSISLITSLWVGLTTGSRTFIITSYIVAAILLFFFFSKHKIIYLSSLIVLTVLALVIFNSIFENRLLIAIQTLFGNAAKSDTATISRELYMDYGILLGSRNIIVGYGVNGFGIISGVGTYAHNNYAEVLCDFGVVGTILFYLPLFVVLIKAFLNKKIDKRFVIAFVVYYFIASFSNVIYYKKLYYLVLALMFYLAYEEPFELKEVLRIPSLQKIIIVCDTMGSGGAERVISTLSNQFVTRNIETHIIGIGDTLPPQSYYNLNDGIIYESMVNREGNKKNRLSRLIFLRKRIKAIAPDVVISFLPNANIYTWISLIGLKTPHIVSERNNPYIDPKSKIERLLKKVSFVFSDGCVFQTKDAMNYYPKTVQKRSVLISNPLSLNYIPEAIAPIKRNNVVLSVGRLTEQKNYKCLLDAFKLFNDQNHNAFILKIVGEGPLRDKLIEYSKEIGVYSYVNFVGNDKSWHEKEYNDAMFVLSSNYEGMPNALLEAMALGIPCISTNCPIGGPRELIQDGVNGYLVPVNDPFSLANKMNEVVNQPSNLFCNSTRSMIKDYSSETITNNWISFIQGLTKEVYE